VKITTEKTGGVEVVHFSGAADVSAVAAVRQALRQGLDDSGFHLVCDLSKVNFICSDALGAFIMAHQAARAVGGFLRLVQPRQRVAEILATTHLDRLFEICDSLDAARRP
jgi:anti-anti-sigma factor